MLMSVSLACHVGTIPRVPIPSGLLCAHVDLDLMEMGLYVKVRNVYKQNLSRV